MWRRLAGFQYLKPSSSSVFLFLKSGLNLCSSILQAVYSKLNPAPTPANHRLTNRDCSLLPPPKSRHSGETHDRQDRLWCRRSCRVQKGRKKGVAELGFWGLHSKCTLPKTKPMMKIPEKASTSVPTQSQRWRRPGPSTESLSCSGFHISSNSGLPCPSGLLWPRSSASAGQNFLPLLPWGRGVLRRLSPPPDHSGLLNQL